MAAFFPRSQTGPRGILRGLALGLALAANPLLAQQDPAPVRRVVEHFLGSETAGLPGKATLTVGELDPRNQLPPCADLEAFLPAGTRAWGRTNVGVRCLAPATWTVFIPARVAVRGEYLILARPLRAGQIVGPADLQRQTGDLAEQPADVMTDPARVQGQGARFALAAGQTLRASMLRLPPAILQGQKVQVVSGGPGFQVSNEGTALNTVAEGQVAQVRLIGGQVVSGIARSDGRVEIRP
ncbi:MAG: flagellar basal body P-ring formation protein FlgA [Zoogloeaceae bacterium]|nr:flagellar basal body P-ring formation protein FlgA [Zoogloeaceae bacterium]